MSILFQTWALEKGQRKMNTGIDEERRNDRDNIIMDD
jgi:hypothetical protein